MLMVSTENGPMATEVFRCRCSLSYSSIRMRGSDPLDTFLSNGLKLGDEVCCSPDVTPLLVGHHVSCIMHHGLPVHPCVSIPHRRLINPGRIYVYGHLVYALCLGNFSSSLAPPLTTRCFRWCTFISPSASQTILSRIAVRYVNLTQAGMK